MKHTMWLIKQSTILDYKFFKLSEWSFFNKVEFILKKYYILAKHSLKKFEMGKDYTYLAKRQVYYDSKYGLAGYQSILTRHQNLLKIEKVKSVNTVIDIGANVGFFSMLAREMFPSSTIHSIEPIPKIFSQLKKNTLNSKKNKLHNLAITDKNGEVKMSFHEQDSAVSKINKKGKEAVVAIKLDKFIKDNQIKKVDILKIDTEGYESHVLRYGKEALSITRYLHIEITMKNNPNYTISSLMGQLYSKKYNFQLIGFRNYKDSGEGEMPVMDCFMKNLNIN